MPRQTRNLPPKLGLYERVPRFAAAINSAVITFNYLLSCLKFTNKEVIWLVGDGRSGTTWLANILNYHQKYRFMFEPFHPIVKSMHWFEPFQYLRPECNQERLTLVAGAIFSGRFQDKRVDQFNNITLQQGILVKDIFTHLMMGWVKRQFPDIKQILMLRHPCAVAVSKAKLKKYAVWVSEIDKLLSQTDLFQDFLYPFGQDIKRYTETYFENLIAIWCVVHYVPLCQFDQKHLHLVFYEELCTNPENEIRRLLTFLGHNSEDLQPDLITRFRAPSQTCRQDSAVYTKDNLINWWHSELTTSQLCKANDILKIFELDQIYQSDSPMPNCIAAESVFEHHRGGRKIYG